MIICPSCQHSNPEGATTCELCFTSLPMLTSCPQCSQPVQDDAIFCGNCGYNLKQNQTAAVAVIEEKPTEAPTVNPRVTIPLELEQETEKSENSQEIPQSVTQHPVLYHVQTDTEIQLKEELDTIHLGRPNDIIPPDIDISTLPNSDIVSRVHADIRREIDGYYLEDMGSANGTYVNGEKLAQGNRHRLTVGDRFSLGKEDKVTFIFSMN